MKDNKDTGFKTARRKTEGNKKQEIRNQKQIKC